MTEKVNDKKQDFYAVVSAIVKFIEEADRKTQVSPERNGLIENNK